MSRNHVQVSSGILHPRSSDFVNKFGAFLVAQNHLSELSFERARRAQSGSQERFDLVLTRLGLVSEENLARALASFLDLRFCPKVDLPTTAFFPDALKSQYLANVKCIPVADDGKRLVLAMADPFNDDVVSSIGYQVSREVERAVALSDDIRAALHQTYGLTTSNDKRVVATVRPETELDFSNEDVRRLEDLASEAPIIQLVQDLILRASALSASDIHLEPQHDSLHVRVRVDGALRTIETYPTSVTAAVTSRVKIMANLNIAERRLPQGGRIKTTVKGREIDLRVSTMPTMKGESIVLRLLDRKNIELEFSKLGMGDKTCNQFNRLLQNPNGIILVTGPTGSGKTTTLYAALRQLNKPECKIFSIEDPIEYELVGINQIQTQPKIGLTFANILRSVLRQDPDIIMVGEIRDRETAEIAIQAALTGHLVLSTLHTNNAAAAIARLLDMGIENFLLASSLKGILAQRLVRKLCTKCAQPEQPSATLNEILQSRGLNAVPELLNVKSLNPSGCAECGQSGFHGRSMVSELLLVNDNIRDCIMTDGSEKAILQTAITSDGMEQMFDNGLSKVLDGTTTLDEVLRVSRTNQ